MKSLDYAVTYPGRTT